MTSNPGSKLVTTLFDAWEKANINFVVLRNYDELPDCIDNDIDILVSNETLPFAEEILKKKTEFDIIVVIFSALDEFDEEVEIAVWSRITT